MTHFRLPKKSKNKKSSKNKSFIKSLVNQYGDKTNQNNSTNISGFTKWETQVYATLKNNKIKFDEKFRKYKLQTDNEQSIEYSPDFLLADYEICEKEIIIEAHEELKQDDVAKYSQFLRKYHSLFYVIMIVQDNELRQWNKNNENGKLFDDIWTIDNIQDLITWIKKLKPKSLSGDTTTCPHCKVCAIGTIQIESIFGYRKSNNKKFPQSLCRSCRILQSRIGTSKLKEMTRNAQNPMDTYAKRFCTGCDQYFITKIADQAFCDECTVKYWPTSKEN